MRIPFIRTFLSTVLLALTTWASAQSFALETAIDEHSDGEIKKAVKWIKKAQKHEDTKNKARTWFQTAKIMTSVATAKDSATRNLVDNPSKKALEAIEKCKELDKANDYQRKLPAVEAKLSGVLYQNAFDYYKQKEFKKSYELFKKVGSSRFRLLMTKAQRKMHKNDDINNRREALKSLDRLDTTAFHAFYYAGLSAEGMKQKGVSLDTTNLDSAAMQMYGPVIMSGIYEGEAILRMANILQKMGQERQMYRVVNEGLKEYPQHEGLLQKRALYYIQKGQLDSAEASLKRVIKKNPDNKGLRVLLGSIYDNFFNELATDSLGLDTLSSQDSTELSNEYFKKAKANYDSAITKDSSNYNAIRGLAMLYYNKGAFLYKGGKKKLQEKGKKFWRKGIPLLEKALDMKKSDTKVAKSLMTIHGRLGNVEKYKAVKKKAGLKSKN